MDGCSCKIQYAKKEKMKFKGLRKHHYFGRIIHTKYTKICKKCGKVLNNESISYLCKPGCDKYCLKCGKLLKSYKRKYCETCKKDKKYKYNRIYNRKYYLNKRNDLLRDKGEHCVFCGQIDVDIHHIIPLLPDSGRRHPKYMVKDEVMPLCRQCHRRWEMLKQEFEIMVM